VETVASEEFTKAWIRLRQYSVGLRVSFRDDWPFCHQSFEFYNHFFDMKKILLSIVIDAHKLSSRFLFVTDSTWTGNPLTVVSLNDSTSVLCGVFIVCGASRPNTGDGPSGGAAARADVRAVVTDNQRRRNCEYE